MAGRVVAVVAESADTVEPIRSGRPSLAVVQTNGTEDHADAPIGALFGVPLAVATEAALLASLDRVVSSRRPTVFVGLYASLFRRVADDARYRELLQHSVNYPDGHGVASELRKRGVVDVERLATTDTVHPMARLAAKRGWRVGLYGAAPGTAERAAAALQESAPGVQIVATWDGYSGGPTDLELRAARLDMLFVALGAPRQEIWAQEVGVAAGIPAVLTCGGLFDFLAGDKRRAPGWVQRVGCEWMYRVLLEPRRLLRRYLVGNAYFLRHVRADRLAAASSADRAATAGAPAQPLVAQPLVAPAPAPAYARADGAA